MVGGSRESSGWQGEEKARQGSPEVCRKFGNEAESGTGGSELGVMKKTGAGKNATL